MANLARRANHDSKMRDAARLFVRADFGFDLSGFDAWVRNHYRFRPESEELLKDPLLSLDEIQTRGWFDGDCDDASMFYAAALRPFFPLVRFVAIRYKANDPEFTHVFVEAMRPGMPAWVKLDATVEPGTEHVEIERIMEYV